MGRVRSGRFPCGSNLFHASVWASASLRARSPRKTAGTGTFVGTITDNSGAVISGVKVAVVNIETPFTSETVTSTEGAYQVPYLAPGVYRIKMESPGFKRYVREGVQIRTGEIPRIDAQLEVGAVTESIRVEGSAPLIDTQTAQAGLVLSGDQLLKIPVSQKRAIHMTFYYSGAQPMSGFHILKTAGARDGLYGIRYQRQ